MEITIDNIELFWYSIEQLQSKVDDLKKSVWRMYISVITL